MKKRDPRFKPIILALLLLPLFLAAPSLAPKNPGLGDRLMDKAVISGRELRAALGRPIARLRLLAFRGGKPAPIPFQIDERTPAGDYVMTRPGGKTDSDSDHGLLDANDELVFMARDAGEPGDPASLSPSARVEIRLRDPLSGAEGVVYLLAFDQMPPPLAKERYVTYTAKRDCDEVVTPYYTIRLPKNDVFIRDFIIHSAAGGNDKDIMDRIKMRSGVEMLGGAMSILRTEDDFVNEVLGVAAGPVRVIRQTSTRLNLILSLKSPSAVVNGSFFEASFEFPSMLSLPFRMDMVASDASIRQGWDLNHNALGMKFFSNLDPAGVLFDGKMDADERKLAANPNNLYWALVTGAPGTFLFRGVWDHRAPFRARLYYEDDQTRSEPPEEEKGVMGFAYRLDDLLKMGGQKYSFNIENYVTPNFDGNVDRALRVFNHPLTIEVKG